MALIVEGKMPKGCCWKQESGCFDICKFRKVCGRGVSDKPLMTGYRHRDCPIIGEIPDKHGRLIDADALPIKDEWTSVGTNVIWDAPTVLEASTKLEHVKALPHEWYDPSEDGLYEKEASE